MPSRVFFAVALLTSLVGCAHAAPTSVATRAIGCLPGDCHPRPTPKPSHVPAPGCGGARVKAIGCIPGDCPPKPCR